MKQFWLKRRLRKWKRRLEKYGDDPLGLKQLAELYIRLSQRDKAITYFQQAIEAYYQGDTRLGNNNGFILELCERLLEIDPLNVLAHQTLGQEYCGLSEFNQAITVYQSFANKLIDAGQYEAAATQYRNVLVLDSENSDVRQKLFSVLWRLRKKEEAVQELRKLAELAQRAGHLTKALEYYKKANHILPADAQLRAEMEQMAQRVRKMPTPLRLVVNA